MVEIAKVFMSGRSQAVRLPRRYRFDCAEVEITRDGDALVLRPRRPQAWGSLTEALRGFDAERFDDCFGTGWQQPESPDRPELDDLLGPACSTPTP